MPTTLPPFSWRVPTDATDAVDPQAWFTNFGTDVAATIKVPAGFGFSGADASLPGTGFIIGMNLNTQSLYNGLTAATYGYQVNEAGLYVLSVIVGMNPSAGTGLCRVVIQRNPTSAGDRTTGASVLVIQQPPDVTNEITLSGSLLAPLSVGDQLHMTVTGNANQIIKQGARFDMYMITT